MDFIRVWLITGDSGIGKTTMIQRVVKMIQKKGYSVGGILSKETREKGRRTGFDLIDITFDGKGVLSSTYQKTGPRVGKYRVNLIDLKEIGSKSILNSLEYCDVTICDEVGPMELLSPDFRRAVKSMIDSNKIILCIIHKNMRDPVIADLKSIPFAQLIEVTLDNRESLSESLVENIITQLEMKKHDE